MNKLILLGLLTKEPEMKYNAKGTAISTFTVAVTCERNRDEADFINVVTFGKLAENMATYCKSGKQVMVEGRLELSCAQKDNEPTKFFTKYIADKMQFLADAKQAEVFTHLEKFEDFLAWKQRNRF
jgi:single-strand DNA-binding protein